MDDPLIRLYETSYEKGRVLGERIAAKIFNRVSLVDDAAAVTAERYSLKANPTGILSDEMVKWKFDNESVFYVTMLFADSLMRVTAKRAFRFLSLK